MLRQWDYDVLRMYGSVRARVYLLVSSHGEGEAVNYEISSQFS